MTRFVVCVSLELGDVSNRDLTLGMVYALMAEERGLIRIVDDSGEDYLYPVECFENLSLSEAAAQRLHDALAAKSG